MIGLSVALVFVVVPWLRHDRDWAMAHFRDAISDPDMRLSEFILVDAIGYDDSFALLVDTAKENPWFSVDTTGRFAQVHRQLDETGQSTDVVFISKLDGVNTSYRWHGPIGLQIDKIAVTQNGVEVLAFGDFSSFDVPFKVERSRPVDLFIDWPAGKKPTSGDFFYQVYAKLRDNSG